MENLLKECIKMCTLDHPNILPLIGVCIDGGPAPFIIMPFMFNGSLLAYLKKERENLVIPPAAKVEHETVRLFYVFSKFCAVTSGNYRLRLLQNLQTCVFK